jgi:hypothetical protein
MRHMGCVPEPHFSHVLCLTPAGLVRWLDFGWKKAGMDRRANCCENGCTGNAAENHDAGLTDRHRWELVVEASEAKFWLERAWLVDKCNE